MRLLAERPGEKWYLEAVSDDGEIFTIVEHLDLKHPKCPAIVIDMETFARRTDAVWGMRRYPMPREAFVELWGEDEVRGDV